MDVASKIIKIYVPGHLAHTAEAEFKWSDLSPAEIIMVQGDPGWSISLLDMEPEPEKELQPVWSPPFPFKEEDDLEF